MSDITNYENEEENERNEGEEVRREEETSGFVYRRPEEEDDEQEDARIEAAEEEAEEAEEAKNSAKAGMIAFAALFFVCLGLLVYYQFYNGNGHWNFTLKHKTSAVSANEEAEAAAEMHKHAMDSLKNKYDSLETVTSSQQTPASPVAMSTTGTWFEVQIGAFSNFNLRDYNGTLNTMHEDKDGGLNKLTLGRFTSFEDAKNFRNDMQKIGVKKAWIVKKVDGNRVSYDTNTGI